MTRQQSQIFLIALCAVSVGAVNAQSSGRRLSSSEPEVIVGDRLFFETRFAQYFFEHYKGDVNSPLEVGDQVVQQVQRPGRSALDGPFRGKSISCRHCHLGDDFIDTEPLAQRTYVDFTARSLIPQRQDGLTHTVRNSPVMVDIGMPREVPVLLHFDGEFADTEDLVIETLSGRNMGWKFDERATALAHIARVIREDLGVNPRNVKNRDGIGVPYRVVLASTDPWLPSQLRIPIGYRVDVQKASDMEIVRAIARLIHAYMDSIRFGIEDTHRVSASPYDLFLEKNRLPTKPAVGELQLSYARRLLKEIRQREEFEWVTPFRDGSFALHSQSFHFGARELAGLVLFLSESAGSHNTKAGNCIACHTPPRFTDHSLHNTGVAQADYDAVFGAGAFAALSIPDLVERSRHPAAYLPASAQHPSALNRFRSVPSADLPGFADLGVWNVFANADFPKPQRALNEIVCAMQRAAALRCTPDVLLPLTIALFKTPPIRDLGHSDPYFHSGSAATFEEVLKFYVRASDLARAGELRNGSLEMRAIRIETSEVPILAAFLRSLNEDYH